MMPKRQFGAVVIAALVSLPAFCASPSDGKLSGSIAGFVRDNAGIPQMGATVALLNRYERVIKEALTNDRGIFGFDSLPPDFYSVSVSLASFVPAVKHRISVQPGMQSLLYINMASVLSSVELVYAAPGQGALMSDDWKWTLKASSQTRPVLRVLPVSQIARVDHKEKKKKDKPSPFSDTRGLVNLSAGDNGSFIGPSMQSDLGTAFAFATSIYGDNRLLFSGNLGYIARSGLPAAGFRTTWTRDDGGPEITVTMRQISMPGPEGGNVVGAQPDGTPALRTMSFAAVDHIQISDSLRLDYGASLDSISFLEHTNYISPFARLTYELGSAGAIQFGYSGGGPPTELYAHDGGADVELSRDLTALAALPQITLRDQNPEVQRTRNFEVGYQKHAGSRVYAISAFDETVTNAAFTMSGPTATFSRGDLLPDLSSDANVVDAGRYSRTGFSGSVTQHMGDHVDLTVATGRAGVLRSAAGADVSSGDALRNSIYTGQSFWASARASAVLPVTGTQIAAGYQWMEPGGMMPEHFYVTQNYASLPGLNIRIRQPIPAFAGLPGRMEAVAELQNLLAQEYLSAGVGPQRVLLTQTPRAVRGGVSFIF